MSDPPRSSLAQQAYDDFLQGLEVWSLLPILVSFAHIRSLLYDDFLQGLEVLYTHTHTTHTLTLSTHTNTLAQQAYDEFLTRPCSLSLSLSLSLTHTHTHTRKLPPPGTMSSYDTLPHTHTHTQWSRAGGGNLCVCARARARTSAHLPANQHLCGSHETGMCSLCIECVLIKLSRFVCVCARGPQLVGQQEHLCGG
jgi:hypothetical protein